MIDENGYIIEEEELNQEYESSYFLILTSEVLEDERLTDFQKLLFAAITGLCKQRGYCWASNDYLEKKLHRKVTQVSTGISKLVELGYLNREIVYKRKQEANGKIVTTKQISYRKLTVNIPRKNVENNEDQNRGILENQNRGILENQNQINNNIINNYSNNKLLHNLSSVEQQAASTEMDIKDNNYLEENKIKKDDVGDVVLEDNLNKDSKNAPVAPAAKPKGGLAPLIDEIDNFFSKETYPDINTALNQYLHCYIGCRRLPSLEKWKGMLKDLIEYSSSVIPGTSGKKINRGKALIIIEKASKGKDGAPFTEFDNLFGSEGNEMEPQFNLNQEFKKGF